MFIFETFDCFKKNVSTSRLSQRICRYNVIQLSIDRITETKLFLNESDEFSNVLGNLIVKGLGWRPCYFKLSRITQGTSNDNKFVSKD